METRTENQKEEAFQSVLNMMERDHVDQTAIKALCKIRDDFYLAEKTLRTRFEPEQITPELVLAFYDRWQAEKARCVSEE